MQVVATQLGVQIEGIVGTMLQLSHFLPIITISIVCQKYHLSL